MDAVQRVLRDGAAAASRARDDARKLLAHAPVVIAGAGVLGRRLLQGLRENGLDPVAFADNDSNRWNTRVDGVPVLSVTDAAARYAEQALFVVAVWNAGRRRNQVDVRDQLLRAKCRNVVSFAHVFRCFPDALLPYFAIEEPERALRSADAIAEAFGLLEDEASRTTFLGQLRWRLDADFEQLPSPREEPQYFPSDLYTLRTDETFIDCGAFNGDTLREFLALTNGAFTRYYALEPDPANFASLERNVKSFAPPTAARVTCLPLAASDHRGTERFDSRGSASSVFSDSGGTVIDCAPLDELVGACTIIKLDVEGAEPKVLHGAARILSESAPIAAISAYHLQSHLWELPLLVHDLQPRYSLTYRVHNEEGFDLVLYAIPPERYKPRFAILSRSAGFDE